MAAKPKHDRRPWPFGFLIVAGLGLHGCDSGRASSASVTLTDSAEATVVVSHEARWAEGEAWTVPAEPQETIGVLDGDEKYQFFDVSAAARQSDGDLVVADAGSRTVRLYGPGGVFKKLLGSGGAGPGEFQDPSQVLVQGADSIFVWDDGAYRITRFDSAGNFAGVHTFRRERIAQAVAPPLYPGSALLLTSGELLVRLIEKNAEKSKEFPGTGRFRPGSGALRVSPDLEVIDTVMLFGDVEQVSVDSPWGPLPVVPALARSTSIAVQPTEARVCIGAQEGPEVRCFEPGGSTTILRWRARPVPLRGNERELVAWHDSALELYGQKLSPDDARRLVAQVPVPTEWPEYSEIVLDREGNLWVQRGPTASHGSEATEYLVFDRAGRLLGPVLLPPVRIVEIGKDYVIGVHADELEIQYLQFFELVKPATSRGTI